MLPDMNNAATTNTFKFRAECRSDVSRFAARLTPKTQATTWFEVEDFGDALPDVEVTLHTNLTYGSVLATMRCTIDGHVMLQTLGTEVNYNGIRDYDRR